MVLKRLREKREEIDMTVESLGVRIGMTARNISRLESGGSTPTSTAHRIAKALRCPIDELKGE